MLYSFILLYSSLPSTHTILYLFFPFLPTGPSFWPPINISHAKASSRLQAKPAGRLFSFFHLSPCILHTYQTIVCDL